MFAAALLLNVQTTGPAIGDLAYWNETDGLIYVMEALGSYPGTAVTITDADISQLRFSKNGQFLYYINASDGNKLYKKSATTVSDGTALTSFGVNSFDLTPDGNSIVYFADSGVNSFMYVKNANDWSAGTQLTTDYGMFPAVSPDGLDVVYTNNATGGSMWKKSISTLSNGSAITSQTATYKTYSPDGTEIVYKYNGYTGLYKKSALDTADGSTFVSTASGSDMSYSPEGEYLAYFGGSPAYDVYLKKISVPGNWTVLGAGLYPAFSPLFVPPVPVFGTELVYDGVFSGSRYLFKKDGITSGAGSIVSGANDHGPVAYSPDGAYIYYANLGSTGPIGKIYKKNANDSSSGSAITTTAGTNFQPCVTPDGNYVVYANNQDGDKLYKKSATDALAGSAITSIACVGWLTISPDGTKIVYTAAWWVLKIKDASTVSDGTDLITSGQIGYIPLYSPDGNYLVFTEADGGNILRKSALDGSDWVALTSWLDIYAITYSADGLWISYADYSGSPRIMVKDSGTFGNWTVTNSGNNPGSPCFSTI